MTNDPLAKAPGDSSLGLFNPFTLAVDDYQPSAPEPKKQRLTGRLDTWEAVRSFIFAGNATFTLVSLRTQNRFTYKVRVKKEDVERFEQTRDSQHAMPEGQVIYFVNLLRGPDNEADFTYMGIARKPGHFHRTAASKVSTTAASYKGLIWMLDAMRNGREVLGVTLEVWHEGRCGRCGRKLTVPESIAAGLGPECAGRASL